MKKATTKRDRKYGKKNNDGIEIEKPDKQVKVMVDYAYIMKFKNTKEAEAYITKQNRKCKKSGLPPASYIFV